MGSCNFVSLWKIYSCLFIPNCTWNHVITYTNRLRKKERDMMKVMTMSTTAIMMIMIKLTGLFSILTECQNQMYDVYWIQLQCHNRFVSYGTIPVQSKRSQIGCPVFHLLMHFVFRRISLSYQQLSIDLELTTWHSVPHLVPPECK